MATKKKVMEDPEAAPEAPAEAAVDIIEGELLDADPGEAAAAPASRPPRRWRVSSQQAPGLRCRKCGCRHFLTRDTDHVAGGIRRYKVCRNCGAVRTTFEA